LSKIDFKHRRVVGGPSFEPHRKIIGCASHEPDLSSEAIKRAIWERKPLPPEVLADALQDRCHDDAKDPR